MVGLIGLLIVVGMGVFGLLLLGLVIWAESKWPCPDDQGPNPWP